MRSMRSRLILGSALVALMPLAVTTFVLTRRMESMVRSQAEERLASALDGLTDRWWSKQETIQEQLHILVRDPALRRLYLVQAGGTRELSEYVAERRQLLGLDVLRVVDPTGTAVVMDSRADSLPEVVFERGEPIYYEHEAVGHLRGGLFIDEDFLLEQKRATGVDLVLTQIGREIASTFDDAINPLPSESDSVKRVSTNRGSFMTRSTALGGGSTSPVITAYVSTASSDRTIKAFQLASLLLGLLGLGLAVLLGALWSSQISRPVEELADFSRRVAEGHWEEPLELHSVRELETLVTALDRMRQDLKTYRERLVTSERHAAWSQMARKVAHEVKNPLTPIAISIADLKRSYEQGRPDFPAILDQAVRTIAEEVERLKHMLQEFSEFGRLPPPRFAECRMNDLFTDLSALYGGDIREGRLVLSPADPDATVTADMSQLRQALVNLLQNGLEAVNGSGRVVVAARAQPDHVEISVADDGPGLSPEQTARLFSPGFTTKAGGSGLGLVMVERIVSDHHGTIRVDSQPSHGTTFTVCLPRTIETEHAVHPDRG
jgi:signal transduction histidine kinase